jgi:hypothetical protein
MFKTSVWLMCMMLIRANALAAESEQTQIDGSNPSVAREKSDEWLALAPYDDLPPDLTRGVRAHIEPREDLSLEIGVTPIAAQGVNVQQWTHEPFVVLRKGKKKGEIFFPVNNHKVGVAITFSPDSYRRYLRAWLQSILTRPEDLEQGRTTTVQVVPPSIKEVSLTFRDEQGIVASGFCPVAGPSTVIELNAGLNAIERLRVALATERLKCDFKYRRTIAADLTEARESTTADASSDQSLDVTLKDLVGKVLVGSSMISSTKRRLVSDMNRGIIVIGANQDTVISLLQPNPAPLLVEEVVAADQLTARYGHAAQTALADIVNSHGCEIINTTTNTSSNATSNESSHNITEGTSKSLPLIYSRDKTDTISTVKAALAQDGIVATETTRLGTLQIETIHVAVLAKDAQKAVSHFHQSVQVASQRRLSWFTGKPVTLVEHEINEWCGREATLLERRPALLAQRAQVLQEIDLAWDELYRRIAESNAAFVKHFQARSASFSLASDLQAYVARVDGFSEFDRHIIKICRYNSMGYSAFSEWALGLCEGKENITRQQHLNEVRAQLASALGHLSAMHTTFSQLVATSNESIAEGKRNIEIQRERLRDIDVRLSALFE